MAEPRVLALPMTGAYFRLILRRFGTSSAARAALLADTGVRAVDDDADVPVAGQLRQLANLDRLVAPGWGLAMGAALDGAAHGPAGAAIVTAPTLGAALETMARYATVRTPFIDFRTTRRPDGLRLEVVETCALGAIRTALLEMVLSSVQSVAESALGRTIDRARFWMPAPRPGHWRRYETHFHAPVRFEGHAAAVWIPAAWLRLPCPLADAALHRSARARLEIERQRLDGGFIDATVDRLLASGDDAGPTLAQAAARLRISPRTLVRRLGGRRTSYRVLRDAHRKLRAAELLAQRELTIAEVAERLGYEAPTNFGRACRRWFGISPRAYRRTEVVR